MRKLILIVLLTILFFSPNISAAESLPIQIRFTAANFNVYKNTDNNNSGISLSQSQAGYDLVWDANVDTETGYLNIMGAATVLFGSGQTTIVPPSGDTCSRELTPDPAEHILITTALNNTATSVVIEIPQPGAANNNGNTAALDFRPNSAPYACGVPQAANLLGGIASAGSSYKYSPTEPLLPTDSNPDSAAALRTTTAVIKFNAKALPATIYTNFTYTGTQGTISTKNVWFGRVEITPNAKGNPQAVNPFFLGGYKPPANLGDLPDDPPANLTPSPPVKISDFVKWAKKLFSPSAKGLGAVFTQLQTSPDSAASTTLTTGAQFSYDPATSILTGANVADAPPGSGSLSLNIVFKKPDIDPDDVKASVPAAALKTTLTTADNAGFTVLLNAAAKKALASGKAFTVFISAKFQPDSGGKAVLSSSHFKLKAKKKK